MNINPRPGLRSGLLWGGTDNQVELGNELSIATAGRFKFRRDHGPLFHGDSIEQKIVGVARFVFDVHLGNKRVVPGRKYCRMYVRRPAGVGNRQDGAEPVVPCGIGDGVAVSLEVLIHSYQPIVAWVVVAAVGITLPYFDAYAGQRMPVGIHYATEQVGTPSVCYTIAACHPGEVVVVVQRQSLGVERTSSLSRCGKKCRSPSQIGDYTRYAGNGQQFSAQSVDCGIGHGRVF